MSRLLVWACVLGSLLVVATFVPVGGRTVAERWRDAPSAFEFAERGAKEVADAARHAWGDPAESRRSPSHAQPAKAPQRTSARAGAPAAKGDGVPQERHTASDRSALDRIVAEHSGPAR